MSGDVLTEPAKSRLVEQVDIKDFRDRGFSYFENAWVAAVLEARSEADLQHVWLPRLLVRRLHVDFDLAHDSISSSLVHCLYSRQIEAIARHTALVFSHQIFAGLLRFG